MMKQENKRPVTLEDILALKRTERPPAEFWNQFDRELRAKQLAAIVEKRPWWRTVPRAFGSLSRYHLPLGATAILALTVLTVREYRSTAPHAVSESTRTDPIAISSVVAGSRTDLVVSSEVARAPEQVGSVVSAAENDAAADSANFALSSEATTPGQLAQIIPLLGSAPQAANPERDSTPTARFIAANLALAQSAEPAIAQNMLGASHGFETRGIPSRAPVAEPLAHMASPSDVRRSRLFNGAAMAVSMNSAVPARPTESRPRRLSDDQLYDTISRIDARGNSVGLKF